MLLWTQLQWNETKTAGEKSAFTILKLQNLILPNGETTKCEFEL